MKEDFDADIYAEAIAALPGDVPVALPVYPCIGRGIKRPNIQSLILPKELSAAISPRSECASSVSTPSRRIGRGRAQQLKEHASCEKKEKTIGRRDEDQVPVQHADPQVLQDQNVLAELAKSDAFPNIKKRFDHDTEGKLFIKYERVMQLDLEEDFPPLPASSQSCQTGQNSEAVSSCESKVVEIPPSCDKNIDQSLEQFSDAEESDKIIQKSEISDCPDSQSLSESIPKDFVTVKISGFPVEVEEDTIKDMVTAYGCVTHYEKIQNAETGTVIHLRIESDQADMLKSCLDGSDLFEGTTLAVSVQHEDSDEMACPS